MRYNGVVNTIAQIIAWYTGWIFLDDLFRQYNLREHKCFYLYLIIILIVSLSVTYYVNMIN